MKDFDGHSIPESDTEAVAAFLKRIASMFPDLYRDDFYAFVEGGEVSDRFVRLVDRNHEVRQLVVEALKAKYDALKILLYDYDVNVQNPEEGRAHNLETDRNNNNTLNGWQPPSP